MFRGFWLSCYKMNVKLYVQFFSVCIGILFLLIREFLRQQIVLWLDINYYKLKKALIRELLRQAHLNWFLYRGDATDGTWLDNWLLSEEVWFLLAILGTSSVSTCWFTFVCWYCWLTWNSFGPSTAFRFQVRVCVDISCPV